MEYPPSLRDIVSQAASQHRDDIDKAVDCAYAKWLDDPEREDFVESLERQAIREHIHFWRHRENVEMRREAGMYGGPAKVGLSTGAANRIAEQCWLETYVIGGRIVGGITGKELPAMAKSEREKADGADFNARLCMKLASMVPEEKAVRDVLTDAKFRKVMKELRTGRRGKAA